ncbi:MAG: hypothetical protein J7L58_05115 [Thermoplasmata archaeon]|nr:hypothetical protein [Thermoplasmata archaeon]
MEYETVALSGLNCKLLSLGIIIDIDNLCNAYGFSHYT